MRHIVHLLSGGLDSTVLLHKLKSEGNGVVALFFDYGQANFRKEIACADYQTKGVNVAIEYVKIPKIIGSIITDGQGTFIVPNRNMIFLSWALAKAAAAKADCITFGATFEDQKDFPDCRPSFIDTMNLAATAAGYPNVEICAPFSNFPKKKVMDIGRELGVEFSSKTWSCYGPGPEACGECHACKTRALAFCESNAVQS
jgi:7-cyano-7-deazaguanine synthase